jgi:hypothetical protein
MGSSPAYNPHNSFLSGVRPDGGEPAAENIVGLLRFLVMAVLEGGLLKLQSFRY